MIEETKQDTKYIDITSTDRHKKAKPPREAYLYIPQQWEVVEFSEDDPTNVRRKIFDISEDEYTPYEKDCLSRFHIELEKYNNTASPSDILTLPLEWYKSDTLRFLQAKGYKIQETIKAIVKYISWAKGYFPLKMTDHAIEILNTGFIYGHGRDSRYRPVFVVRSEIYIKLSKKYSYDNWLMALTYFCDYLVNNMLIPGQLENWIIIADLSNTSMLQMPTDVTKLVSILQSNYKCRLLKVYIYGMNQVLNFIWNFVKSMLQPNTLKKIKFLPSNSTAELFESINPDQVEKRYGGNADNLLDNFFPPYMPEGDILLPGESKQDLLITEEAYKEMYLAGKLSTLSPYVQVAGGGGDNKSIYTNPYTQLSRRFTTKNRKDIINTS
jgi:hypothetical protein